ncbi:MAG: 4-hydroxy-tetrahydrodipicolinate synthase [Bacteroidota bacterium]
MIKRIAGSFVALITPMLNGRVDYSTLERLVEWHIEQGTNGFVPVGTTGESPTLSNQEHLDVLRKVIEISDGRIPTIAGCGSNSTQKAIEYHEFAAEIGADAALHVTGYYNKPTQEGIYAHFEALSKATNLPIIVYNVPKRTGVDILPNTMARIGQLSNVVGVKDATADLSRICLERELLRDDFVFLSGEDITALAYNISGGVGCISVTANVAPKACAKLQHACNIGDYATARTIHDSMVALHRDLFIEPNPSGVKYACSLLGLCTEEVRLPLIPISDATKLKIEHSLAVNPYVEKYT